MKTLVVTGWNGFMASHFLDLFINQKEWRIRRFVGDITKPEDCVRNLRDADTVINFAALTYLPPSWDTPEAYSNVNYQGVVNLLQCHGMFKRFIQISTSHVYGNQDKLPIDIERNVPSPQDPYSIAKYAAEKAVEAYSNKYGFGYLIVRPFNNFGPRQSKHFVIPSFIDQAIRCNKILVRGNTEREFIYVKDNVRAIRHYFDSNDVGYKQICQGKTFHVADVAEIIAKAVSPTCTVDVTKTDRPHDIEKLWGVPSDNLPFTPMEQALKETVDFYANPA